MEIQIMDNQHFVQWLRPTLNGHDAVRVHYRCITFMSYLEIQVVENQHSVEWLRLMSDVRKDHFAS